MLAALTGSASGGLTIALCGCGRKESYGDIVMTGIVGSLAALVVVIALGSLFGAF